MGLLTDLTDAVGLTDSGAAEEAMDKATGLTKDQMRRLDAIDLPDEEKMRLALESPELIGLLSAETIDDSKLGEISLDPALRENQMKALQSLTEQSEEGLTATDKYAMEKMLGDVSANERSNQAAIEAEMARKGMDSSGAALMAKMQSGQSSANNARDKAMQMAAQGQQNRMAALSQLGNMSGNMQSQDFSRQSSIASAQDAIARANAMNRQNVSGQNLAARQNIENQRANIANQQQTHNKGLEQQQFQNKMAKAGAQNTVGQNQANMYQSQAGAQAAADANTMGTMGKLAGAYFTGGASLAAEDGAIVRAADGHMTGQASGGIPSSHEKAVEYAEKEMKQHENFKKKYMKKVQSELLGEPERSKKEVTRAEDGAMYASDGMGADVIDSGMESYAGDRVDAKVNDGEAVINVPQQQRLMDLIRGEISVDELGNDDIIEGVPREFRDEMHDDIEEDKGEDSDKMEAIQALLEMLGEK